MEESITMAILGPVSTGKSTLLNSLFCDTLSEMKRKRTTMLPQIYTMSNNQITDSIENIYSKNKESNEQIFNSRMENTFNITDFKELIYHVKPLKDFISLDKKYTYSILDMPGLNDQNSDLYYDYIRKISKRIDIYIILYDVQSSLNTTDEVKILSFITELIKENEHGYLNIVINKCNDFIFKDPNEIDLCNSQEDLFDIADDELKDLYNQAHNTAKDICKDINWTITPLCTNKLYVYRTLKHNPKGNIAEAELDIIIKEDIGKSELKKLINHDMKKKYIIDKLKKDKNMYESAINHSKIYFRHHFHIQKQYSKYYNQSH